MINKIQTKIDSRTQDKTSFCARVITLNDLEKAENLYGKIFSEATQHPQSIKKIMSAWDSPRMCKRSPFSDAQIDSITSTINEDYDVLLSAKENKTFHEMVMKVYSTKAIETSRLNRFRTEVDIAQEIGLFKWLETRIIKSKDITLKNFEKAQIKIEKLQNRINEKNTKRINRRMDKVREKLV